MRVLTGKLYKRVSLFMLSLILAISGLGVAAPLYFSQIVHAVAPILTLTAPAATTITRSALIPEMSGVPTGGNAAVDTAIIGLTPIDVTITNTGDAASAFVRLVPIGAGSNIQFWTKATDGTNNWYDINVNFWPSAQSFYLPANYSLPTKVYAISDVADSYPWKIDLVLVSDSSLVASKGGTVTVVDAALAAAKVTAKADVETALSGYLVGNYTGANWTILNAFHTDGDIAIDAALDLDAVASAKNTAINGMDGVATIAETLAAAKVTAKGVLTTAFGNYIQGNYTTANWIVLTGFKTTGDTNIDAATTLAGVTSAQTIATEGMAGVEQTAAIPTFTVDPTSATITKSAALITTTDQVAIGTAIQNAKTGGLQPIKVTLKNTGDAASAFVRLVPIDAGSNIQFWTKDTLDVWYNINDDFWESAQSFSVLFPFNFPADVYAISDVAGSYPWTINLVLVSNPSMVVASTGGTVNVVDTALPILNSVSIFSNNTHPKFAKQGNKVTINFVASENLMSTPIVTIAGKATTVTGAGTTWSAVHTMGAGDAEGFVSFTINFNDLSVNAGLEVTTTSDGSGVLYDRTKPTATISTLETSPTKNTPLHATITFSEPVINFVLGDIAVTNGSKANFVKIDPTIIDTRTYVTTYSTEITPLTDGVVTINILANKANDVGNNANVAATQYEIFYDSTDPTITINPFITNDNTPKLTGTVNDNSAAVSVSINGNTFTATNKGDETWELTDGTITPSLSDGTYNVTASATDTAGNIGTDSTDDELTIDTVAPTAIHKYYRNGAEVSGLVYAQNVSELTFDSTVTDNAPSSGLKYETFSIFEANGDGSFGWNTSYCGFRQSANTYNLTGTTDTITGKNLTNCVSSLPDGEYYVMHGEYDNAARGNDTSVTQYSDSLGLHFIIDATDPTKPTADPVAGDYTSDKSVTLASSDTGSGLKDIYYTLDGTTPDKSKTLYAGAITVNHDVTIKAIAYDNADNASSVLTAVYGIAPVISGETSSSVTSTTATITWTTDDLSTSRVVYDTVSHSTLGTAPSYGYAHSTTEDSAKVTAHSVGLTGLTAGTTYYYRTISHGSPDAVSPEESFTTSVIKTSNNSSTSATPATPATALTAATYSTSVGTEVAAVDTTAGNQVATTPPEEGTVLGAQTDQLGDATSDGSITDNTDVKGTSDTKNDNTVWSIFGLAWYWWLLILAAIASAWWIIAAAIRRNHQGA